MRCPSCEADVQAGARFCPQCAAPMPAAVAAPADPLRAALEAAIGFQYQIMRPLGRGGMGAVYLAHELALDREVAIKVLPPERGETPESRERFRREARTAARLNHSHVVPLYTFGEVSGIVYYVMGYVKGEPLSARLRREGRLAVDEARRILAELADALDYAHRQGVVHRDLKPDNVLLEEDSGRALLADFGIAKTAGAGHTLTATGSIVGTPLYMSPEQASGRGDVDGRSDLYSLGVIGYEMLAGRRPFDAPTPADVLVQHMTKEPPALAPLAGGAPEPLVKAVTRCLAKDPAARWPDARSLRQALTPVEEETELPRALSELRVAVQASLLMLIAVAYFHLYRWASGETEDAGFLSALARIVPVAAALILPASAFVAHRRGHAWQAIFRAALLQPSWWLGPYARQLRPTGDVWDRLPLRVRRVRLLAVALVLYSVLILVPVAIIDHAVDRTYVETGKSSPLRAAAKRAGRHWSDFQWIPLLFLFLGIVIEGVRAARELRRRGRAMLDDDELERLFVESTGNRRFWGRPAVAAILAPAGDHSAAGTEPTSPDEIERALRALPDSGVASERELLRRARGAAAQARHSLAALDEELRALEREYDAVEAKRLEERLAAIGEVRPDEPHERRQMRELLGKQAELLRGFASRIEAGRRERSRRLEQMRALWRQADVLRSPEVLRSPDVVARLQTLCEQLERGPSSDVETLPQSAAGPDAADAETLRR